MMESRGHKERRQTVATRLLALLARYGLLASLSIIASVVSMSVFAGAPIPDIPKGEGDKCVEDTQYMRESHMDLLLHQRDDTLRRGIRTKKHSLKECLTCHVVKDSNNQAISAANPKHFCRACHDYASVNIDCFDCHASKPGKKSASSGLGSIKPDSEFGLVGADSLKVGDAL